MSSWKDRKFFKDRVRNSIRIPKIENSFKALVCAGIQIFGGATLTAYAYNNPTYRILPFMYSAIAIGGAYNVYSIIQKDYGSVRIKPNRILSAFELANGVFTYSAGVYALSEGLRQDEEIWIPCFAIAASGYYFSITAFEDLVPIVNRKPILQFCHLMFDPALIACAATYLIYFRNHEESCLYWLPFVITGISGFNIAADGFSKADNTSGSTLLLKVIKTMIGSCIYTFSCLILTIYGSKNNFPPLWIIFMMTDAVFGVFLIFGSLTCLRRYIDLDIQIFLCFTGLVAGSLVFTFACLAIHYVEDALLVCFIFLLLAGFGHFLLCNSVYQFYKFLPGGILQKFYLRLMGPVVTVYSSLVTAGIGRRMGWRYSVVTMPFIPAGIYATYRGFKRDKDSDDFINRISKIHEKHMKNVALIKHKSSSDCIIFNSILHYNIPEQDMKSVSLSSRK